MFVDIVVRLCSCSFEMFWRLLFVVGYHNETYYPATNNTDRLFSNGQEPLCYIWVAAHEREYSEIV